MKHFQHYPSQHFSFLSTLAHRVHPPDSSLLYKGISKVIWGIVSKTGSHKCRIFTGNGWMFGWPDFKGVSKDAYVLFFLRIVCSFDLIIQYEFVRVQAQIVSVSSALTHVALLCSLACLWFFCRAESWVKVSTCCSLCVSEGLMIIAISQCNTGPTRFGRTNSIQLPNLKLYLKQMWAAQDHQRYLQTPHQQLGD